MAEGAVVGLRAATVCGGCGKPLSHDTSRIATFCPDCGCCLLAVREMGALQPLVPPRVEAAAAWERLRGALPDVVDPRTPALRASRLLFVPFHEWPADLSRARVVRDARAPLAPAADLLPAAFRAPESPRGDDRRGLAIAETAHKGRLADPAGALALIAQGEAVDVMIPPPSRPPEEAAPSAAPRLLYYPLWFLTYTLEYKEERGVVDAVTGEPVGASSAPRIWVPALAAAAAGLLAFAALAALVKPPGLPAVSAFVAAAGSWAAAAVTLSRLLRRERGR